ncbi:MAG: EpsG family protein [Paludibacter sp.]|nr:EpsG family protein [Paludibacter sp.]
MSAGSFKKKETTWLVFVLLQPFIGLLASLKYYKSPWVKNILWFFVVFYGFTLVISNSGIDANRIRDSLLIWHNTAMSFSNLVSLFYSESSTYLDVVQPTIMFLVSRLTSNYHVIFAVYGLVFGYFYSRNIWYILDRSGKKIENYNLVLIITFASVIGFWNINGFRMYSAAHVFFFGAIRFLLEGKKKGLLIASTSLFFHFSFMLPVVSLILFSLIKNRIHFFYIFFVVTFFMSEINITFVRDILLDYFPSIFDQKINGYVNETYAENIAFQGGQMVWYARIYYDVLRWVVVVYLSVLYFTGLKQIQMSKKLTNLFCYSLFFIGIINIVAHIPSMGRFYAVGNMFAIAFVFLYMQNFPFTKLMKNLNLIMMLPLLLYLIVVFRLATDTMGIITVLGNPLIALFFNPDIAIIQLLK